MVFAGDVGCPDQIAILQEWCVKYIPGNERFMAFLDIKAAYDSVDRELLWRKCRRRGCNGYGFNLRVCLVDDPTHNGICHGPMQVTTFDHTY